mmetsp:Transcript_24890/g.49558  ORF Transcript_24890/g.49558 Transcript_24890/m.49558 type:complete len:948 (+) Transcript_24890:348-3191(+)
MNRLLSLFQEGTPFLQNSNYVVDKPAHPENYDRLWEVSIGEGRGDPVTTVNISSLTADIRNVILDQMQWTAVWENDALVIVTDRNDKRMHSSTVVEKTDRVVTESIFEDPILLDQMQLFVDQIKFELSKMMVNASTILDRLEQSWCFSSHSFHLDHSSIVEEIPLDHVSLDNLTLPESFNFTSLGTETTWLQDLQNEASIINSWKTESEKLSRIAYAAFQNMKNNTSNVRDNAAQLAAKELEINATRVNDQLQRELIEKKESLVANRHDLNSDFRQEAWTSGGFEIGKEIESQVALDTILSLPLNSYKLKDDWQKDIIVNRIQRRTRIHTGVIFPSDHNITSFNGNETNDRRLLEPSTIFSYNIGAVSQLAKSLDMISSRLQVLSSFLNDHSSIQRKVNYMKNITASAGTSGFQSPGQLASEVASLETEAALKRIIRLSRALVHTTKMHLIRSRFLTKIKSLIVNDKSSERMNRVEREVGYEHENVVENCNSNLDSILIYLESTNQIKSIWNATKRKLFEFDEKARIESHIAQEEIHAEASVERENEMFHREQIKLIGQARMEEVVAIIENFFHHIASCLHHIISTDEGRRQFLFYIAASSSLVFVATGLREALSLISCLILRFLSAPRLVREYGNLWSSKKLDTPPLSNIILPNDLHDRVKSITNVASSASKMGFHSRHILIHGPSGTGKSILAKAIAQSIPSVPYALMSGSDVAPMGRQGPAELCRLLTWASKNRNGGIIIIEDAELLLGSRARSPSEEKQTKGLTINDIRAASFARDCLNVLLSMTGSFGNIMLILTTCNPSDLDEAVLDRCDELLHLPIPDDMCRRQLIVHYFDIHFRKFMDDNNQDDSSLTSRLMRFFTKQKPIIVTVEKELMTGDQLELTTSVTAGFSGREIAKLLIALQSAMYTSRDGCLDFALAWKVIEIKVKENNQRQSFDCMKPKSF